MMRFRAGCSRGLLLWAAVLVFVGLVVAPGFSQAPPQLIPNIVTTVAGNGTSGSCSPGTYPTSVPDCTGMGIAADGSSVATAAKINQPFAVATDSLGQVYIGDADGSYGYIFKVDTTGHISLFAGGMKQGATGASTCDTGTDTFGSGCPANRTYNKGVRGIVVAPNGDVYYDDFNNNLIFKVDHVTGIMNIFAGTAGGNGYAEGGPGTGKLANPYGLAFDSKGNLFIPNKGTGSVDMADSSGYIHHVVGNGTRNSKYPACPLPTSGLAKDTQLYQPSDVAFDQTGNLYVADIYCQAVYKVAVNSATGVVDADSQVTVYSGANNDTGTLTQATGTGWQDPQHTKSQSQSVAVDFAGNVYIGDQTHIVFCDAAVNICHTMVGGASTPGCQANNVAPYDGCPGPLATIKGAQNLAFDAWGNLYFSDAASSAGYRTRKVWLGTNGVGMVQMLAHYGVNDGPATANPVTGAVDFVLGLGNCTTNSDNTQDCVINANAPASGSLIESFTLTSLLGGSSGFYMTNQLYPTCQAPTAAEQSVTVTSKTATFTLSGQAGAGCSGIEMYPPTHHTLTFAKAGDPSHGTVDCNGASCTYTPEVGYAGPDSFAFTASDPNVYVPSTTPVIGTMETLGTPLVSNPATVNITVQAGASPSDPAVSLATDITQCSVDSTCSAVVTATVVPGTNPESTGLAVTGDMSQCTGGSATQVFTPGSGTTFTYVCSVSTASEGTLTVGPVKATDAQSRTSENSNTVTIHITTVPTNPTVALTVNPGACRLNSTCTVTVTAAVAPGINPLSTGLAVTGNMSACNGGSATQVFTAGVDNVFTYSCSVPTAAAQTLTLGPAVATDAQSRTSMESNTVALHVIAAPVAQAQILDVSYETAKAIALSATGSGTITYVIVTGPSHGTLSAISGNLVTYTPASSYAGPDSFTFKANNGFDSDPATITLNVLGQAPVAEPQTVVVTFNTPKTITLTASGQGTITYAIATGPSHGTVGAVSGNQVTYTPVSTYSGPDSFTFTASNGVVSEPATITLNILPAAPVASAQSITVAYNTPATVTLSATGTGTLTYTVLTQPASGQLSGRAPYLTYTPNSTYSGSDSFTFKATDGNSQDSAETTISLTVNGPDMIWAAAGGRPTTLTVSPGGTANYSLQLTGWTGSSETVKLTCSGGPAESFCSVGPPSTSLNSTTPIPVSVSVVTTGPRKGSASLFVPFGSGARPPMGWVIVLAALLPGLLLLKKSRMQWRLTGACATLLMVMALGACGNSHQAPPVTQTGTYTVTVTATAGTVAKSTTLTLVVQ